MSSGSSYYSILGVSKTATEAEIKESYRRKLLMVHPDKHRDSARSQKQNPGVQIQSIQEAYRTLINPEGRAEYEEDLSKKGEITGIGAELANGLEALTLDDFNEVDHEDGSVSWKLDCPRCTSKGSFEITENDLVRNMEESGGHSSSEDGSYMLVIQCTSCTLWLQIKYYDLEE